MEREIMITTDGSHSVWFPGSGVSYHSRHGAIQESMHVFIDSGLRYMNQLEDAPAGLSIFEMGFGTGLNALLSFIESEKKQQPVYYEAIEAEPLSAETWQQLNYCTQLGRPDLEIFFRLMHSSGWDDVIRLAPWFQIKKVKTSLVDYNPSHRFDLVYFDAFAPEVQPELWTGEMFRKLFLAMANPGVLTTYCSKSVVRKAMTTAGFTVEKIPGPPHKREIVRAHTFAAL